MNPLIYNERIRNLKMPLKPHFTTKYFYKGGMVIGKEMPTGDFFSFDEENFPTLTHAKEGAAASEYVTDYHTYEKRLEEYSKQVEQINREFYEELAEELGIEDNPKKDLLFQKAREDGESHGFEGVYSIANDLVELIL